jgi:microcystin degradation protein MlrC
MRIFVGSLATETNTFSPVPTDLDDFRKLIYFRAGEHPAQPTPFTSVLWVAREFAERHGWTIIEGLCAGASPGGLTTRHAYETLREQLLADLSAAGQLDMVVLQLHGAMVADGYEDCEGDLLQRAREIVPDAVIGVLLDPHCHTTQTMIDAADVIIMMKEYPHTDGIERSRELVQLCLRTASGEIRPRHHLFRCGQISLYHTTEEPMIGYVADMKAVEDGQAILSVSLGHGFPWGDVPEMGTHVLVVSNDAPARGDAIAQRFGEAIRAERGRTCPQLMTLDQCMDSLAQTAERPVVIADCSDNPGGGAPSDSTYIIRRLLAEGYSRIAVGMIWDAQAVRFCKLAGQGARRELRVGGKTCRLSGQPLDFDEVEVTGVVDGATTDFGGAPWPVGTIAGVRTRDVGIVLSTGRVQCSSPDVFAQVNLDLADYDIIIVKSSQHFRAAFSSMGAQVLYVAAPGVDDSNFAALPFRRVRRPLWPLDVEH